MTHDLDFQHAAEVQARHSSELLSKPHVVGLGIGHKHIGGINTGQVALIVMVDHKIPNHLLPPDDRLPAMIEGVPVDVQETGAFTTF
jgi:hypothetical protein